MLTCSSSALSRLVSAPWSLAATQQQQQHRRFRHQYYHHSSPIMCLIVCSWNPDASPSLIVAANRDEYFDRPSRTAQFWRDDQAHIYGGRDLQMGGTWLACSTQGRFATVTNYHEKHKTNQDDGTPSSVRPSKSRGELPVLFLGSSSSCSAMDFATTILQASHKEYGGYNAFLFDGTSLVYCSNRGQNERETVATTTGGGDEEYKFLCQKLTPGIYGVSNHLLDTPWPKLVRAKQAMADILVGASELPAPVSPAASATFSTPAVSSGGLLKSHTDKDNYNKSNPCTSRYHEALSQRLLEVMRDDQKESNVTLLPTTLEAWEEHIRSAIFVTGPTFGTRTTSILTFDAGPARTDSEDSVGRNGGFDMTEQNHKTLLASSEVSFSQQHIPRARFKSQRGSAKLSSNNV
jgi:uncharacterized protein with NRDE domain